MKKFRKNTRGQFVVIAALLIAILTLSVALSIHQINLHRQQLRYEPVEELVLGITSDLDRCLTHSLSIATQLYDINRSLGTEPATKVGENFIFKWIRSIRASYANLGINVAVSVPRNETAGGETCAKWTIDWSHPRGISQVYTKFDLDIDAYGFKGWVGRSSKFVTLEILDVQDKTVQFRIRQGTMSDSLPIPNLTPESLYKTRIHIDEHFWASYPELEVTDLTYLGEGVYSVTFNHGVNQYTKGVELTVVTPEDNIVVSALHYIEVEFFINLQSQEQYSAFPTNKGKVEFDGCNYTLPVYSLKTSPGLHKAKYFPDETDIFLNWTTTGNIEAKDPYHSSTDILIRGNGTITAFYGKVPSPVTVHVTLDSRDLNYSTHSLGSITLDKTTYTDLPAVNDTLTTGKYYIEYKPENSSYYFWEWDCDPLGNFIFDNRSAKSTTVTIKGNGTVIAVYSTTPTLTPQQAFVNLRSQEENSLTPTDLGLIKLGDVNYTLPRYSLKINNGTYLLEYFPAEGYKFLNWTTTGEISVINPYSSLTSVIINGNGSIIAFYRGYEINLDSRQWENSSFNLGSITLGDNTYKLPKSLTGVAGGKYLLQYTPENSSYKFLWWESTAGVFLENNTNANTMLEIYGDGNVTAVYSLVYQPPPSPSEEWDILYLCDLPPSMLLPYSMLPQHYFNPRSSTLPIPPRDSWQYIDVCTPPTKKDMTLAKYINITLYIQLASGKAENITIELKFIYNNTKYLLDTRTFYNLTGEAWYTHIIDTDKIDKTGWPFPGEPIIPEGSVITLTIIVPPNSGTLHIVYGWERYQSIVDMF
jgi:hypothetical protein